MTKVNSILTDTAIDLLDEIIVKTGNHHVPQIVEAALLEYLNHLRQQAEYTAPTISDLGEKE
jgi:hypothetical protein